MNVRIAKVDIFVKYFIPDDEVYGTPVTLMWMNASSNPFKFETKKNSSPASSRLIPLILKVDL